MVMRGMLNNWTVTTTDSGVAGVCLAIDGAASTGSTLTNSMTISHTTAGTDRLMLVGVSIDNEGLPTVTSVTYNGIALTVVGTETNADDARVEIWQLTETDGLVTGTHDVVITFSADLVHKPAGRWRHDVYGCRSNGHLLALLRLIAAPALQPASFVSSAVDELVFWRHGR